MPKPRSQTPQPRPNSDSPEEPPESLPLFRLTFLGSSRHVLNWRTADFRQLKKAYTASLSGVRVETSFPFLSRTTTSTTTSRVPDLITS